MKELAAASPRTFAMFFSFRILVQNTEPRGRKSSKCYTRSSSQRMPGRILFFFFLLSFLSYSFGFWYLFRPSIKKRIRWSSDWRQKKKHRGLVAAGGLLVVSSVKVGTEALPCLCVCIFISVLYYWQGDLYIYILSTTSTVKQKKDPRPFTPALSGRALFRLLTHALKQELLVSITTTFNNSLLLHCSFIPVFVLPNVTQKKKKTVQPTRYENQHRKSVLWKGEI